MEFNFDQPLERRNTDCRKWDAAPRLFGADDILPMWIADMDFAVPPAVAQAIAERAAHPVYGYPHKSGRFYEAVRYWLQRRHNWQVHEKWVLGTPGVVAAISTAILAFTEPGDKVMIQTPVYPPFFSCVTNNNRQLVENPLVYRDGRYAMDLEDFAAKLDGVKLLLLCSPHNPVGRVWSQDELTTVVALCAERGIIIVSDEIHADLILGDHIHTPIACMPGAQDITVTLMAASKSFNVAGFYTSLAIIENIVLRKKFLAVFEALDLNSGNIFGLTALTAAYLQGEDWLEALLAYLDANAAYMTAYIDAHIPGITLARPEATFLAWLDCRGLQLSQSELKQFFVQQAKVGLNDGRTFGSAGEGFMRLNFGCSRYMLQQGLERIAAAVRLCGGGQGSI